MKNEHTDTTLPNKLFDYMLYGKPIVASNLSPIEEILDNVGCGNVFVSGNPTSMADKVSKLIDSGNLEQIGKKGIKEIKNQYNWNIDFKKFMDSIDTMV